MMKTIKLLALLFTSVAFGQIKGNGTIVERSIDIDTVKTLEINLTANFILDASSSANIKITADENITDYILLENKEGYLNISQKEWISPSVKPTISIGVKYLEYLINDAHTTTKLLNIERDSITIDAKVGKIVLEGSVKTLNLTLVTATIDATNLNTNTANVTITSYGSAKLNVTEQATTKISKNGTLKFVKEPKQITGNYQKKSEQSDDDTVNFINFELKNNTLGVVHHLVVVGPKKNDKSFSYGFSMGPLQVRKERWSVGSKLYKNNPYGKNKLLFIIKSEDEGNTLSLFNRK